MHTITRTIMMIIIILHIHTSIGFITGVAYVNIRVSKHLKEELTWVIDKWLQVISNKMLLKKLYH